MVKNSARNLKRLDRFIGNILYLLCSNILWSGSLVLTVSRRYFFVDLFILCLSLLYCLVFVMQPFCHPLGRDCLLGLLVFDVLLCICHFLIRYPGSGVVPDCIDS